MSETNTDPRLDKILAAIDERNQPQATHKQVYVAISNYIKNELGYTPHYFENVVQQIIKQALERMTDLAVDRIVKLYTAKFGWEAAATKAFEAAAKTEVQRQIAHGVKITVSMKEEDNDASV